MTSDKEITVIYPFRDRDVSRVENSIASFRERNRVRFEPLIVDYGSSAPCRDRIRDCCDSMGARLVRVESGGLPWNRSHALNIGVKQAATRYVVTTDIDMIDATGILDVCIDEYRPGIMFQCAPVKLPRNGDFKRAERGGRHHLGVFQFIEKQAYLDSNGLDERFQFWGLEDTDWHQRLLNSGYRDVWLDDRVTLYHVWHPESFGWFDSRPVTSWFHSSRCYMQNARETRLPQEMGKNITLEDRPILRYLEEGNWSEYDIGEDRYLYEFRDMVRDLAGKGCVKVNLGSRFQRREKAFRFFKFMDSRIRPFLKKRGYKVAELKTMNYDYFHESIPLLKERGMRDFYVAEDCSHVFMLF